MTLTAKIVCTDDSTFEVLVPFTSGDLHETWVLYWCQFVLITYPTGYSPTRLLELYNNGQKIKTYYRKI